MESIVPWAALCEVIEQHYHEVGNGRPSEQFLSSLAQVGVFSTQP
jgi:hypothetical protein